MLQVSRQEARSRELHGSPDSGHFPMVFCALPLLQMNQELHLALRLNKMLQGADIKGPQIHVNEKRGPCLRPEESLDVQQCPRKMEFLSKTRRHTVRSQALLGSWTSPEILLKRLS